MLAVPTDGVKSLLYAQRANLFGKRGIQADVVPMGSGAAIFSAIVGGSADIGSGSLFPVFAAYARGLPLRIIAPASLYSSDHADKLLLVAKDSPIKTARDLNGKTVGVDAVKDVNGTATRACGGGLVPGVQPHRPLEPVYPAAATWTWLRGR